MALSCKWLAIEDDAKGRTSKSLFSGVCARPFGASIPGLLFIDIGWRGQKFVCVAVLIAVPGSIFGRVMRLKWLVI